MKKMDPRAFASFDKYKLPCNISLHLACIILIIFYLVALVFSGINPGTVTAMIFSFSACLFVIFKSDWICQRIWDNQAFS